MSPSGRKARPKCQVCSSLFFFFLEMYAWRDDCYPTLLCEVSKICFPYLLNQIYEVNGTRFPKLHNISNIKFLLVGIRPEKQTKQNPLGTG